MTTKASNHLMGPNAFIALASVLVLILRNSKIASGQGTAELDEVLAALLTLIALQHEHKPPDADTPYQDRVAQAITHSLEVAASNLCSTSQPFPENIAKYLVYHSHQQEPTIESASEPEQSSKHNPERDQDQSLPFKLPLPPSSVLPRLGFLGAVKRLLAAAEVAGKQILYHPSFPEHFALAVAKKRLFEVESHLEEYTRQVGILWPQDYTYLADVLEESTLTDRSLADRLGRSIQWLRGKTVLAMPTEGALIQWTGTNADLVEVAYALYEARLIKSEGSKLSREQLAATFAALFGARILNPRNYVAGRMKRADKSVAPALEKMLAEYLIWVKASDGAPTVEPAGKQPRKNM